MLVILGGPFGRQQNAWKFVSQSGHGSRSCEAVFVASYLKQGFFAAGSGGMMSEKSRVQLVDSNCVSYAGDLGRAVWKTNKQ